MKPVDLSSGDVRREQNNSESRTTEMTLAELRVEAARQANKKIEEDTIAAAERANKVSLEAALKAKKRLHDQGVEYTEEQMQLDIANIDADYKKQLAAIKKLDKDKQEAAKKKLREETKQRKEAAKQMLADYNKQLEEEIALEQKKAKKKQNQKEAGERADEKGKALTEAFTKQGMSITDRFKAFKTAGTDSNGNFNPMQLVGSLTNALADFAKKLDKDIEDIAKKQSTINTRLYGSDKKWQDINKTFNKTAGASPLIRQADLVQNLETMVDAGINYNVEQRAFLATISKKIATTFNAADATMLKLIRLQQKDSTAARLGMEATMNAFLNNMYENTEYLKGVAEGVRSQLAEAESLMSDTNAVEFEYQMQKWLGSLYSVGMSQEAVNNIAGAVGKLAAGDISGITGGGTSNLLMMAANQSGISITDALADGLDASQTNRLMQAMVTYLAGLYNNSRGSKVLQQQFAQVYGVKASDLRAALNLSDEGTMSAISGKNMTYGDAMQNLMTMAGTMYQRTSMGEMLENAVGNLKYTMASGIANNPALYATYKVAGMLDDVVGGIPLPFINTFFGGVDLHTSVANLMRTAAMSGSILSGIGGIINSLGGTPGMWGTNMLKTMGVGSNVTAVRRGSGGGLATSGVTVSESGYAGNASGSDVQNQTMGSADEQKQEAQATEEDNSQETMNRIDENVAAIKGHTEAVKTLLEAVANGQRELHVNARSDVFAWSPVNIPELGH